MRTAVVLLLLALLCLASADHSDISQEAVLKKIYDTIFYAYTGSGGSGAVLPGLPPGRGPDQTFLSIANPGLPIDAASFANPWSPNNPTGSTAAAEAFSLLVDVIPALQVPYISMGSLEDTYNYLVSGQEVAPLNITDQEKQAFDKAKALLTKDATDYDESGKPVTVQVDSDFYTNYKRNRQAYTDALGSYLSTYFQYNMSDPQDQRMWAMLGQSLFTKVKLAYDDFQKAQPGVVEQAISVVDQFQSSSVKQALTKAKADFDATKRASVRDPSRTYHVSYASPANWFSPSAGGWSSTTINFKEETLDSQSHYSAFQKSWKLNLGLFSIGGSYGHSESFNQSIASTTNLAVSFDFLRCEIQRPWLKESLFNLLGYRVPGVKQFGFSSGKIDASNQGTTPLLAKSLILVKNVKISADWSQSDTTIIHESNSSGFGIGWGPFTIGVNYDDGSGTKRFKSAFDGRTLTIPDPQVVGVLSTVVAPSPPEP